MKNYFRRQNPTLPEELPATQAESPATQAESPAAQAEVPGTAGKAAPSDNYEFLITASDNSEAAVIESILRSARIPYVLREHDSESWMRVMMGFNVFGSDFFVPAELVDDAAALLVPDGEGIEITDEDGNGTDGDSAGEPDSGTEDKKD